MRIPYIGVTRFSVVSPKGSGLRLNDSIGREAYLNTLFDDERMQARFDILSQISAPIYQSFCERHNYVHIIQYSPELPMKWKIGLDNLQKEYPVFRLHEVREKDIVDSVVDHVRTFPSDFNGKFVWLRVDDDDVLAADYLDALDSLVEGSKVGHAISFGKVVSGIYLNGNFADIHLVDVPKNSQGQAYVCSANLYTGHINTPKMLPHHKVDEYLPLLSSNLEPHAFWTRHPGQDTALGGSTIGAKLSNLQGSLGQSRFFDKSQILAKFPTLASRISKTSPEFQLVKRLYVGHPFLIDRSTLENWPKSSYYRIDYSLTFDEALRSDFSGGTFSFDFGGASWAEKQFPNTPERGDYRRAFADRHGNGTIFCFFEDPCDLKSLTFNMDKGQSAPNNIQLSLSLCQKGEN